MSGYGFRYDSTGTKCSGAVRPGTLALAKWAKKRWSLPLVGTYNCRQSRAGGGLSTHGEGRGADLHVHTRASEASPTPKEKLIGDAIAFFMVANAEALGIQAVIWLDSRWDSRSRKRKHYSGPFHGNHVHVELCRPASERLTTADLDAIGTAPNPQPPEEDVKPEMIYYADAAGKQGWYNVAGNVGWHIKNQASVDACAAAGVPFRSNDGKGYGQVWIDAVALLDGPCANR